MDKYKIQIIGIEELKKIAPLFDAYRVFYGQKSNLGAAKSYLKKRLADNDIISFLAKNTKGEAVGFANIYKGFSSVSMTSIWILNDLYILPKDRRQGIAQQIMIEVEGHAARNDISRISLQTAKDNLQAQKCYEKQGWEQNSFVTYQLNPKEKPKK